MRYKLLAVCAAFVLSVVHALDVSAAAPQKDRALTVMTRNMDLGTDFTYILIALATGAPPFALLQAITSTFEEAVHSNMAGRALVLAAEIRAAQPDFVALQEVSTVRRGPSGEAATTVVADQLALLRAALAAEGVDYQVVDAHANLDFTLPSLVGSIALADHDVVLARADLPVSEYKLEAVTHGYFATTATFHIAGQDVAVPRGWIAVDAKRRGKPFRLVTTHLEPDLPLVQAGQTAELLSGPLAASVPTILAGDLNSDARAPSASAPAYSMLVAAGWTDAWSALRPAEPGLTWPMFGEDPPFGPSTPFQRIDLVLAKGAGLRPNAISLVGANPPFASDHAGLNAEFILLP